MKAQKQRQFTLLTLVVALGVAVYLNWEYAKTDAPFALQDPGAVSANAAVETVTDGTTSGVRTGPAGEIEAGHDKCIGIRSGDGWWFLNTGVPHYVEMVHDVDGIDVNGRGRGYPLRYGAVPAETSQFRRGHGQRSDPYAHL